MESDYIEIIVRIREREFREFFSSWIDDLLDRFSELGIDDEAYDRIHRILMRKFRKLRLDIYYALEQAVSGKTIDVVLDNLEETLDKYLGPRIEDVVKQVIKKHYPGPITNYIKSLEHERTLIEILETK